MYQKLFLKSLWYTTISNTWYYRFVIEGTKTKFSTITVMETKNHYI